MLGEMLDRLTRALFSSSQIFFYLRLLSMIKTGDIFWYIWDIFEWGLIRELVYVFTRPCWAYNVEKINDEFRPYEC